MFGVLFALTSKDDAAISQLEPGFGEIDCGLIHAFERQRFARSRDRLKFLSSFNRRCLFEQPIIDHPTQAWHDHRSDEDRQKGV